jgi:hypothetical protein
VRTVKARALIGGASYDPTTLRVLYKAFDDAWDRIRPQISARAEAMEAARTKLAEIVLGMAQSGIRDAQTLTDAAVRAMLAAPTQLRR